MNVFGQLKQAIIENTPADFTDMVKGFFWFNTTSNSIKYNDGTAIRTVVDTDSIHPIIGYTPYATESLAASGAVTINDRKMQIRRVQSTVGPVVLSTTPFGTATTIDGLTVKLVGMSDTDTIGLTYNDIAHGLLLNGDLVLAKGNVIELFYDASLTRWIECYRNF